MGPVRLDRTSLQKRLADVAADWVLDELMDAFEPAFARYRRLVEDRKRKTRKPDREPGRPSRRGRASPEEETE